jgi:hypothetical protein
MSLATYDEVRAWAPMIRLRVADRTMPPWHVDRTVGVQEFRNDRSLSEREVSTILAWIDQGAPRGSPQAGGNGTQREPRAAWALQPGLGDPDLIVASEPYSVPARGPDLWSISSVPTGLGASRWLRAVEVRPAPALAVGIVHHVVVYAVDTDGATSLLTEWAMGKPGEVMPGGTSRLVPAGSSIAWDIHSVPMGEEVASAEVELALWFHPEGYEPQFRSRLESFRADAQVAAARGSQIDIPPGELRMVRTVHRLRSPARIESFQPHMHLRGRAMSLEARYPDGRTAILSRVDRFDPRWQTNYLFAEAAMPVLPAGSELIVTAWHDNTAANPHNPDPRQWVGFGRRAVDEMAHAWVAVSYLEADQYTRLAGARRH